MGEHLLALRQVARGIACSANSIHPMFTIVRLGRTVVQEGTLHLMDEGYQVPVVLVLFDGAYSFIFLFISLVCVGLDRIPTEHARDMRHPQQQAHDLQE